MSPDQLIKIIIIFFVSVMLHEYAHGWIAYVLGDPTAKRAGRLTLNPFKHIDPIGTIALPAVLLFVRSPVVFGWAKPIPVNFLNLRYPKRDMMWVGLSGPVVNISIAVMLSQFLRLGLSAASLEIIEIGIIINLVLAAFNLIPIPPLDGSRLVMGLLPNRYAYQYARLERYGILIVFVLLYFGVFQRFIWPLVIAGAQYLGVR